RRSEATTNLDPDAIARLQNPSPESGRLRAIPEAVLKPVVDDVMYIVPEELTAYATTVRQASRMDERDREQAEHGNYALFSEDPEWCRGKAWQLRGKLRRTSRTRADLNSYGTRVLYDCWISTPDSGSQLLHVIAVTADEQLPLSEFRGRDAPEIELTGYYFKREGYLREGNDGLGEVGLAPLLITGRIQAWVPPISATPMADDVTPWLGWGALLVCVGVVAMFWAFYASDRSFRHTRTHQLASLPVTTSFDKVEVLTINDMLRRMEQEAEAV
ncbi:MAG: hypothetical protein KDA85_21390, partial [Planctomycetaceae bacterium]|nr:hypothetical protein [Planctomycetaceae bacterium]